MLVLNPGCIICLFDGLDLLVLLLNLGFVFLGLREVGFKKILEEGKLVLPGLQMRRKRRNERCFLSNPLQLDQERLVIVLQLLYPFGFLAQLFLNLTDQLLIDDSMQNALVETPD